MRRRSSASRTGCWPRRSGPNVTLAPQAFNAGPDVIEAIFSGALDASYIGPNPAINGFTRSNGEALRIVAGTTSGGAALVVSEEIATPDDLAGTMLATPQLGNTQDVALRAWLADQGYTTDLEGGGDVSITPQANGQALEAFIAGEIDGAWVPEPWATRMVGEGGGHVLVERGRSLARRRVRDDASHRRDRVPRSASGRRQGPPRRSRQRRSTPSTTTRRRARRPWRRRSGS